VGGEGGREGGREEEVAPELLPFQTETVQDLHALVKQQQVGRGREGGREGRVPADLFEQS